VLGDPSAKRSRRRGSRVYTPGGSCKSKEHSVFKTQRFSTSFISLVEPLCHYYLVVKYYELLQASADGVEWRVSGRGNEDSGRKG